MTEKGTEPVRAIMKATALLDLLAEAKRPLSLSELTTATGWAKSTVYGLLSSMRSCGLVEQDAQSGRYTLGVRLFEYGSAVSSTRSIIALAKEPMERLVQATGESASLSMLDRGEALVLSHAEADSNFHIVSETGAHLPAFCTAQGKVLLSSLSDAAVRRIHETQFFAFTPHVIPTPDALVSEIQTVREKGYAIENGEFRIGVRGVAAPIKDHTGAIRYAIGLIGMFRRVDSDEFRAATAEVLKTAATLSEALGYREN
ncbi:MAG: IclR family transcriptional regulator [Clostridia bacterium]|nr:IclR family transcriptional regulator [Clostridia bacterium]